MRAKRSAIAGACAAVALAAGLHGAGPAARQAVGPAAVVTARNTIDLARPGETMVLTAADIRRVLKVEDLRTVHVLDLAAGPELLAQPVDVNDDGVFDELVFQADFGPGQSRTFTLTVGARQVYTRDQFRAYGRFVRERRDDFAWENDRVAHRMYGAALETWAQEPLTSSTVDVWVKRTRKLVQNDWYMVDDYHRDHGDGADLYSAGKSRGCGGNGVWEGGKLFTSANFRNSRVLANGPVRVMFELTYLAWDVAGRQVSEMKRITLDAGQNLSRFESHYTAASGRVAQHAVGIKKAPQAAVAPNPTQGTLRTWEPIKDNGSFGCAIVMAPALVSAITEADGNVLAVARVPEGAPAVYYAGFGWDRSGDFAGVADWDRYVEQFARRLASPVVTTLAAR